MTQNYNQKNFQPTKGVRGVSIGEALGAALTILGALITFYIQTQIRLHDLENRMTEKEKAEQVSESQFEKLNSKMDAMRLEIFDIKMEMVKKAQDKK